VSATRPRNVDCANVVQSMPEKSASIVVASAVPTLKMLPVQPRGDGYWPCVLMRTGGVLEGVNVLVPVMVTGMNACWERMVVRKLCRLVSGTTSNVQLMGADTVGSPSRSIVTVPVHVPDRNDG